MLRMMSQPAQAETPEIAIVESGGLLPAMLCSIVFRGPLKHERPGFRPLHIAGFDGIDLEPRSADQVVHLAIEMTTPSDPLPAWRQPLLPASNPDFRGQPMLNEKQIPARFEN